MLDSFAGDLDKLSRELALVPAFRYPEIAASIGIAAAALGLAAGGFAYAARWPASRIFGRPLIAPRRPGELALTFDDGPNPAWTPRLLDCLASYGVHATFFLLGKFASEQPSLVRRISDAGHLIGNHSWSHPDLALASAARIRDELTRTRDALEQITGKPVRFFRPPFGSRRPYVLRAARQLGMTPVLWNAMTTDWSEPSPERIVERLARKIDGHQRRGLASTIVLHDGGHLSLDTNRAPSMAAVERLLAHYTPTHKFITVDAWSAAS